MHHKKTILRFKQVCELTGLARSTVYTRLNPKNPQYDPSFPKPSKCGPRLTVWDSTEIDAWINSTLENSDKSLSPGGC